LERAERDLLRLSTECSLLDSVSTLLEWDEEIAMPAGGVEIRSRQLALMAGLEHERLVDPRLGELLDILESEPSENSLPRAVNVRELRKLEQRQKKLQRGFVEEQVRVRTLAQHEYAAALERNDFSSYAPWLDRILKMKREEASLLANGGSLYDVLLDELEPGMTADFLSELFRALAPELKKLLGQVLGSTRRPEMSSLARPVPVAEQYRFAKETIRALGFDFSRGRLDEARHPFTVRVAPGDCRISTRFLPEDFSEGFFCGLHELGHGLYDQGLPDEYFGSPIGEAASLGIHESQARLWENIVGRRASFWKYFFPRLQQAFAPRFDDVSQDRFFGAINRVAPTFRRVRADEVTYNLHVMIRFELERAMMEGRLAVADLREAWNAEYREHLGLIPPDDASGVLQDGHWASGTFGYFPTYTLGNVIAAQLFAAAHKELGDLDAEFARGNFASLLSWLRNKVHRRGKEVGPERLVLEATGENISPRALVAALSDKVAAIYG
jgi:carboxypeptidase Taq